MKIRSRGVSPVISVVLMVAITVIVAASVAVFVFSLSGSTPEPAPTVGETTGEFDAGGERDEQVVRISHIAGDSVDVEEIEIIVEADGPSLDTEARLVGLPAETSDSSTAIDSSNIDGNEDIIDQRSGQSQIIVTADSNTWSPGDTIEFRVAVKGADFRDEPKDDNPPADELRVAIVHTETDSMIFEETFTA